METKDANAVLATGPIQKQSVDGGELFLRFIVILIGMGIGVVVALFIGLATGWIPFNC